MQKPKFLIRKNCILCIHVGEEDQEEEIKLKSILAWLNRRFKKVNIIIEDTLYRHTLMFESGMSEEIATVNSYLRGDAWIIRSCEALQLAHIPWTMTRWRDWSSEPGFKITRAAVQELFEMHSEVRAAVLEDAYRFFDNILAKKMIYNEEFAIKKCRDLILDKISILPLWFEDFGKIDIYPRQELKTLEVIKGLPLPKSLELLGKLKRKQVWFKRLKS